MRCINVKLDIARESIFLTYVIISIRASTISTAGSMRRLTKYTKRSVNAVSAVGLFVGASEGAIDVDGTYEGTIVGVFDGCNDSLG